MRFIVTVLFPVLLLLAAAGPAVALDLLSPFSKLFRGDEGIVVWQAPGQYVKIVDQDWDYKHKRALKNSHPINLIAEDLAVILASIKAPDPEGSAVVPLFTRDEIRLLAEKLSEALNRSQPDQDVVFGVYDNHDNVASNARRATGCRMFYHAGEINMIFGDVLQPINSIDDDISHYAKPHRAGRRMESNGREIRVSTGPGIDHWEGRGIQRKDWILIDMDSTLAAYQGSRPQAPLNRARASTTQLNTAQASVQQPVYVPEGGISAENRRLREELARARKRMSEDESGIESGNYGAVDDNESPPVVTRPAAMAPVEYQAADNNAQSSDIVQRLSTLKTLYDKQLITSQEYDQKRKEILEQF